MSYDLVIRGGKVIDGTGMAAFSADIAVRDGRIAKIGRVAEPATRILDVDGAVVAPGFIDVHTHYDVQLDWDPLASPACWHGVTTVLTGNCGFTLATVLAGRARFALRAYRPLLPPYGRTARFSRPTGVPPVSRVPPALSATVAPA